METKRNVSTLQKLDENILIEVYIKATMVQTIDPCFIQLLEEEIQRRNLKTSSKASINS